MTIQPSGIFSRAFTGADEASQQAEDKTPAEFWLNIGYVTDDEKYPFVSLQNGIALDKMKPQAIRGSAEYRALLSAQNDLLSQLLEAAESLPAGGTKVMSHPDMPLAFQLRRVRGEQEATPAEENTLSRKLNFV